MTKNNKLLTPHEIVEYAIRIDQVGSLINESLLLEKIEQEDALKIAQANDRLIQMLKELDDAFAGNLKTVDAEIEYLHQGAQKSSKLLKNLTKETIGSEKLMSKISNFFKSTSDPKAFLNAVLLLQSRAQELVEILKDALPKIVAKVESIQKSGTVDSSGDATLVHELLGTTPEAASKGIFDLLKKSQPGIFKSVGNFFKSMNVNKAIIDQSKKVDYNEIAKEISTLPMDELKSIAEGTAKIKTDGGDDLKDIIKDVDDDLKDKEKEPEDKEKEPEDKEKEPEDKEKEPEDKAPDDQKPKIGDVYHYTTKQGKETFVKIQAYLDGDSVQVTIADGKGKWKKSKFGVSGSKLGKKTTADKAGIIENISRINKKNTEMLRSMIEIGKLIKEISEANVRGPKGNIVIEPGLKVRHKKTGLEYSVQDIDDNSDKLKIVLAVPELPRVDITKTLPKIVTEKDKKINATTNELDNIISSIEQEEETIFVVDEKEFEKNYEVK